MKRFDSYTFFPAQHWSHNWERQHEIIYRFAQKIDQNINIIQPLGLVEYNFFSKDFFDKVIKKIKKTHSHNNKSKVLGNMKFISSFYLHKFDNFSSEVNFKLLNKKMSEVGNNNFFWGTYINPTVYKFFSKSTFKILDLAERRQSNNLLTKKIKRLEIKAVKEADIVIVDNLATFEDYKDLNSNIYYIPQGYDNSQITLNSSFGSKIGYIGHLHKHINYEYLCKLIELNPEEEFLIVGPIIDTRANRLKKYKNVNLIGQVPKKDLSTFLRQMKYGLIPYQKTEFTKGVFPTKLFEYLGAGVPVISTSIPEVAQYSEKNYVKIMDIPTKINFQYEFNDELKDFLIHNTWDKRFEQYLRVISEGI